MNLKKVLVVMAMFSTSLLPTSVGATWNGTDQYQCAYTYSDQGGQSNGHGTRPVKSKQAAALAIPGEAARSRGIGNGGTNWVLGSPMRFRPEAKPSAEKACREKASDCVYMGSFRRK